MNADDVWEKVRLDLGNRRETPGGWKFGDLLIEPPQRRKYEETDGSTSTYWVVLVEVLADGGDGYHIVFDENDCQFGLATGGVVVGWYGTSLMKTIEGM